MGLFSWLFGGNETPVKANPVEKAKVSASETNAQPKPVSAKIETLKPQPKEEPTELGVRQKIEIAECLHSNSTIAVASAWVKSFQKLFPTPEGAVNQLFVLCMQVATAWLVMQWYDLAHKKRTAQIMGWYEMATRSKLVPRLISDMHSYMNQCQTPEEKDLTGVDLMNAKAKAYAKWIHAVIEKQGVSIDEELIRVELAKARDFAQFWYNDKLVGLIKKQQPWDATVPRQLPPGSMELSWMSNCKADIARAKW